MPVQAIIQQDLSRGTNLVTNPYVIGKQQSILLTNVLLDEHASLRTRDGTLIQTTSPDVAPHVRPIVKLYNFTKQDGAVYPLAIVQGTTGFSQLYDRSTTPWTLLGTLGTKYAIPDILTFTNLALIVNGYEAPYSLDGVLLQKLVGTGGGNVVPAGAAHHALHQGFYWVWNTAAASTTSDGPSSLRSSDLNNPNSWPAANQLFIDKDDGDSGQGMGQFTIAESGISPTTSQILFKQFKAFQMTGVFGSTSPVFAVQKVKSDMGCVAPRTIKFAPGFGLIRLTHRGFALFNGVQDEMISEEVRPLIFGDSVHQPIDWDRVTTASAVIVPNPPVYLAAVPVCGGTGLSRVFCYDLVRKAWTVLTYPLPIGCLETLTDPSAIPTLDTTGFGRSWVLEVGVRLNAAQAAASVYVNDLTVYAFHLWDGATLTPMNYDVSTDGGVTFPTLRATAYNPPGGGDIIQARSIVLADGTRRFMVLLNTAPSFAYSDTVLTLPTTSTWTEIALSTGGGAAVGAPCGLEASGLNVLIAGSQGGGADLRIWHSEDGGATFSTPVPIGTETVITPYGYQVLCSPSAGVWCLISPNTGTIRRSTDNGATWSGVLKTVTPGDASLQLVSCIFVASATRIVAVHQGQVVTSDDAGLTWTDRQNLTLVANSPLNVRQGGIGHINVFGALAGTQVLGGVSNYAMAFAAGVTAGAMWRSTDLGTTWTIINAVGGGGFTAGTTTAITAFDARNGRGVIDIWNAGGGPARRTWNNPKPIGSVEALGAACPPALAQILLGDYSNGNVREIFGGAANDDGAAIVWHAALRPVSSPSPQANGYFRRMVIKVADVVAGQTVNVYVIVGPTVTTNPRTIAKILTCPVTVGLGFSGFGLGPWGTSPFGGVTENSEMDLTADLGLIGTNARAILQGGGKIKIRGIEYHVKSKPLRRVSNFA